MDFEEYEYNKAKLLDQIDRPYIFHNPELASAFFEQLKTEIPEAAFFVKAESPREVGAQYITASDQARSALLGVITGEKKDLEKELQELDQLIGEISGKGATT